MRFERAQIGDECRYCGREKTELSLGGLFAYCWWCNDRAAGPKEVERADVTNAVWSFLVFVILEDSPTVQHMVAEGYR